MKPMYWRLKGNQGTMVTYVSICFSMMELMCYVWWLSYRLRCNHYGWNETSILEVERKSRYHGYIYIYICFSVIELIWYVWWLSYRLICNHFGWSETSVLEVERKSRYHGYICTYKLQNCWNDMIISWLNDESICNRFDWNNTRVREIERKSRYDDYKWIILKSMDLE